MKLEQLRKKNKIMLDRARKALAKTTKANLVNEMTQISAHIAYFGEKKADALYLMDKSENRMKAAKAELGKLIRGKVSVKGTGSPSDKEVENRVVAHKTIKKLSQAYIEAKWKHETISSFVYGINKKADQLGNMSYILTKEMEMGKMQYFGKSINNKFKKRSK